MQTVRLAAGAAVTMLLLVLCAVLAGPSFGMRALGPQGELGSGALPQFIVVSVAVLAVVVFIQQVIAHRRRGGGASPAAALPSDGDVAPDADPRRVLTVGPAVLAMLAGYAYAWTEVGFLPASIVFLVLLSLFLMPAPQRTGRGIAVAAATAVLFCLGVWALFVHVLGVPLR
ncbi:tripartite tricarboxylate transporter TctB family protein [Azospirillum halopraeferens]|uniref:tripartite tricarboxylate transporter TctB family protein n=1 Tax=Azospirillum halopraeferens TaxID=34010 RepID=UPI0003FC651B|nr:tripartite tricarboxylate transporter TctB family protein [Azospirillum halopraeferens]